MADINGASRKTMGTYENTIKEANATIADLVLQVFNKDDLPPEILAEYKKIDDAKVEYQKAYDKAVNALQRKAALLK